MQKDQDDKGDDGHDKFQAISSLKFDLVPPSISDDDPDLDRYDLEFDNMIAC